MVSCPSTLLRRSSQPLAVLSLGSVLLFQSPCTHHMACNTPAVSVGMRVGIASLCVRQPRITIISMSTAQFDQE
ncbi:hypothetical protein BDR03DRAFT_956775 [Suillus americanus]|nr:hypothetical protein BDR03DRAFT_956775 [Suillus americanus]